MLFNTWDFLIFFTLVFAVYHLLERRAQNVLLLVASYFFYGWWDWRFLSLLLISTLVDFRVGQLLGRQEAPRERRQLLLVSLFTNLGILGFFKYFNFFIQSAAELLETLGLEPHLGSLRIILPVGISFYTFQTMAYTIDVYRRKTRPVDELVVFAVYVSFFPQLVAGPIERPTNLIPQFLRARRVTADLFSRGCLLILVGLVRKVAIADVAAREVDAAFSGPGALSSPQLVRAVFLFALQIYGDFAGYSDIARGTSRLLGIELMENFNHPYFATTITDFWRRWHISLSSWLRDYLYIPLGGNRGTELFTYRNLMLTMLLGGLWHGAGWNFVLWGALHGLGLSVHKLWLRGREPAAPLSGLPGLAARAASWTLTMTWVGLAWVFFRARDITQGQTVVLGILTGDGWGSVTPAMLVLPIGLALLLAFIDLPQHASRSHEAFLRWPWPLRGLTWTPPIMALVLLVEDDRVPFIYFQF